MTTKTKSKKVITTSKKEESKTFVTKVAFTKSQETQWGANTFYSYKASFPSVKGDYIIVDAPSSGYTVVKVVEDSKVFNPLESKALKWVVCKVDATEYVARKSKEKRIEEIKAQVVKMKSTLDLKELLSFYAKKDKSFGKLVEELESLGGL